MRRQRLGQAEQGIARPLAMHVHSHSGHDYGLIANLAATRDVAGRAISIVFTEHQRLFNLAPRNYGLAAPGQEVRFVLDAPGQEIFCTAAARPILTGRAAAPTMVQIRYASGVVEEAVEPGDWRHVAPEDRTDDVLLGMTAAGSAIEDLSVSFQASPREAYGNWLSVLPSRSFGGIEWGNSPDLHQNIFLPAPVLPPEETAIAWARDQGGLISLNHPFGTNQNRATGGQRFSQRRLTQVSQTLIEERFHDASLVEVYLHRGRAGLDMHLMLWDRGVASGLPLYANAVGDQHAPIDWTDDYPRGLTWVLFDDDEEPDLAAYISRLRAGRMFFGLEDRWNGSLFDYRVCGVPMGEAGAARAGDRVDATVTGYQLRATQFDESLGEGGEYLLWRGRPRAIERVPSWVRLEAWKEGQAALFGQWVRLTA
jgi:hypothetical protein